MKQFNMIWDSEEMPEDTRISIVCTSLRPA